MAKTFTLEEWDNWKKENHENLKALYNLVKDYNIVFEDFKLITIEETKVYVDNYMEEYGFMGLVNMIYNSKLFAYEDDTVFCVYEDNSIDVVDWRYTVKLIEDFLKNHNLLK